jgi:hypothetical protein
LRSWLVPEKFEKSDGNDTAFTDCVNEEMKFSLFDSVQWTQLPDTRTFCFIGRFSKMTEMRLRRCRPAFRLEPSDSGSDRYAAACNP